MYRHALPPGFVLRSEKKAQLEAEKANVISLEDFLEVEVTLFHSHLHLFLLLTTAASVPAPQTRLKPHTRHTRILCAMEEDPSSEERSRSRGYQEIEGSTGCCGESYGDEWEGSVCV